VLTEPSERRLGSTCAVEDKASGRPMTRRGLPGEAGGRVDERGEDQAGDGDLKETEAENVVLQPPQPFG
jgi:hypothetical protein